MVNGKLSRRGIEVSKKSLPSFFHGLLLTSNQRRTRDIEFPGSGYAKVSNLRSEISIRGSSRDSKVTVFGNVPQLESTGISPVSKPSSIGRSDRSTSRGILVSGL